MNIREITDHYFEKGKRDFANGKLDLRSLIFQAVQAGMADAYDRGFDKGKKA